MAAKSGVVSISRDVLQALLAGKARDVARQPEHTGAAGVERFLADEGMPAVRLAVVNCAPDMDIWEGLRSPAQVGLHPIGLADIWMHYAVANIRSTRFDGSPNPLAMPAPFSDALQRFKRAVIISAMLPMNPRIYHAHAARIQRAEDGPEDDYCRARGEVAAIINKAVGRLSLALMAAGRAVVPMNDANAARVIDGTRSDYLKGGYHGPCNCHYPQPSIAVMTGLLRFGVNRLPFRDEIGPDGKVRRLMGQYAGIVIFDESPPVTDGAGGVALLDSARLSWMRRV
ncbi:MAG: hypothetical protein QF662_02100, partial [Phycisphaerae bacterium]|nr:hypothetical protein [Phycisphaerae bacterium]